MKSPPRADIGMIGLAVMGENLVLNIAEHGYRAAVWNRTASKTDAFLEGRAVGKKINGFHELADFCANLKRPRKVMMLVKAGDAVDQMIESLLPHLEPGDIIIDGGNSHYTDTIRRCDTLSAQGFHFVGCGVSGGEEGALKGPSLMPGGDEAAWPALQPIFEAIAAKADDGTPCCAWMGAGGAGHFVKMVHNGIEYGDMQLISEAYCVLKRLTGQSNTQLAATFRTWNEGKLDSYLMQITAEIFLQKDPETGRDLIDVILDTAGQKGTGKWTVETALNQSMATPTITAAVYARMISAQRDTRLEAAKVYPAEPYPPIDITMGRHAEKALYASKICSYAQGFRLIRDASDANNWNIDCAAVASIWRGGCIIRARFLDRIADAFRNNPTLQNLLLDPYFAQEITEAIPGWRQLTAAALLAGLPVSATASALGYFDAFRSASLPANLIQAQRDFFGAHTYERIDKPRGEFFHTDWQNLGGSATSTPYNV